MMDEITGLVCCACGAKQPDDCPWGSPYPFCSSIANGIPPMTKTVIEAFGGGDPRCETLLQALLEALYERGKGLPIPLVIGVLRLAEHRVIRDQEALFDAR